MDLQRCNLGFCRHVFFCLRRFHNSHTVTTPKMRRDPRDINLTNEQITTTVLHSTVLGTRRMQALIDNWSTGTPVQKSETSSTCTRYAYNCTTAHVLLYLYWMGVLCYAVLYCWRTGGLGKGEQDMGQN